MKAWSDKQLADALAKWQRILRIQDWDVKVRFAKLADVDETALGHTKTNLKTKDADIAICRSEDLKAEPDWPRNNDIELTLVHELLHVKLDVLEVDEEHSTAEEQVIEQLARSLVDLDRAGK